MDSGEGLRRCVAEIAWRKRFTSICSPPITSSGPVDFSPTIVENIDQERRQAVVGLAVTPVLLGPGQVDETGIHFFEMWICPVPGE